MTDTTVGWLDRYGLFLIVFLVGFIVGFITAIL